MDNKSGDFTPTEYTGINKIFKMVWLQTLINKWYDGTFKDFFGDWKWIFSFSKRYKGIIVFYTVLGLKISIYVNNDIQSTIFNKIIDAEWKELNKYRTVIC